MPRPRVPPEKAAVSGAASHDKKRFEGRKTPKLARPLGGAYVNMLPAEQVAWEDLRTNCPWLKSSDRMLTRGACHLYARLEKGELGINGIQALSAMLTKLGATPADITKVNHDADGDETEPEDKFFGRPN